MRFLVYLLLPVPLAILLLLGLHAMLALQLPQSGALFAMIGYGYAYFGMQSLLFALAMRWLDRRCARPVCSLLALLLGGLCGGSLNLLERIATGVWPEILLFPVLGAVAGMGTALLASLLPGGASRPA